MDIKLFYTEEGTGYPFIFLHGNGEDNTYFEHQKKFFKSEYTVIALDTRGHGKSERGEEAFCIARFAEDLKCFMDKKGIKKAVILGFSDGANIAMRFAIKYPNMLKALILNGGNLNTKGVKATVQIPIEIGYHIAKLFSSKSEKAKKNFELLSLMVNDPNISLNELKKITSPTLVIAGSKDMITSY